jgi:hypothetical protein
MVNAQYHAPAALPPEKNPYINETRGLEKKKYFGSAMI